TRSCLACVFNRPPPHRIYTLSLHDALPILASGARSQPASRPRGSALDELAPRHVVRPREECCLVARRRVLHMGGESREGHDAGRSEEHTSELQSPCNLVCRLLLEKKKNKLE